jgi:hypothetical protein
MHCFFGNFRITASSDQNWQRNLLVGCNSHFPRVLFFCWQR